MNWWDVFNARGAVALAHFRCPPGKSITNLPTGFFHIHTMGAQGATPSFLGFGFSADSADFDGYDGWYFFVPIWAIELVLVVASVFAIRSWRRSRRPGPGKCA